MLKSLLLLLTFIVLILGGRLADIAFLQNIVTYGQTEVLLFGISSALFIFSSQRFLTLQEHDLWSLSDYYRDFIKEQEGLFTTREWNDLLKRSDEGSRTYEKEGRCAYNTAILIVIIGLFFAIASYQFFVAIVVTLVSIILEIYQILK
jgi:hypothetical protein